jgi:hypothetical protein
LVIFRFKKGMIMSQNEALTQHALLVAWGEFARQVGLIQRFERLGFHQKRYQHAPHTKVLEFLVATLAGLAHLKAISRAAHPLDQDLALASAWGQAAWADYSGVSRTLKTLTLAEAQQVVQVLEESSQLFISSEVNLALWCEKRLVYDGDLTGLPVSKASQTYPGVAFGHMDDHIRLGYQAAVVSFRSPTYRRLWLSVDHHPGNLVSAAAAAAMIQAAEARTGVCPWRRTDLLAQRLQSFHDYGLTLQQKQADRQQKVLQALLELEQIEQQVAEGHARVVELEARYQQQQRLERPTSQLALARKRLTTLQKRRERREKRLTKARQVVAWTQGLIGQQQAEERWLQERLARFEQENATNRQPVQAVFRLDAGFGTYENLALLIEMGYEVYTKLQNWKVLQSLLRQVSPEAQWTPVGAQAEMFAWEKRPMESFCYLLDISLERFTDGERVKYCALLHSGPTPVTQDLPAWFRFYAGRQTIEAGIKESKQVFHLHRLKVRSEAAISLQENFVLFAANFIRWANVWLAQRGAGQRINVEHMGIKELVQVAAHTSAEVVRNSEGKLLRFSEQSVFAGKELRLPILAYQLPLPLGKSFQFSDV